MVAEPRSIADSFLCCVSHHNSIMSFAHDSDILSVTSANPRNAKEKEKRVSRACVACRARKTRCDL